MKKKITLPEDYAIVLRQIEENGEEEFINLVETLGLNKSRLFHIVKALQHKGLVLIRRSTYTDMWIKLSAKGQRLAVYYA